MSYHKAIVLPASLVGVVPSGNTSEPATVPMRPKLSDTQPTLPKNSVPTDEAENQVLFKKILKQLEDKVGALDAQIGPYLDDLRRAAVELGVAIAGQLIHEKINADQFAIEKLVSAALARLHTRTPPKVLLHPADLALLQHRLGGEVATLHGNAPLQFVADAGLSRGECKVLAGDMMVWANVQSHLVNMRDALLEALPGKTDASTGLSPRS